MRDTFSRKSAHAISSRFPAAMQLVTIVITRNVALGKCGQPSVFGRNVVRLEMPVIFAVTGSNEFPPSVERVYMMFWVPGTCQDTWITPSGPMQMDGAKQLSLETCVPDEELPTPFHVFPWSVERAKRK